MVVPMVVSFVVPIIAPVIAPVPAMPIPVCLGGGNADQH
jgi:hypothetical protein